MSGQKRFEHSQVTDRVCAKAAQTMGKGFATQGRSNLRPLAATFLSKTISSSFLLRGEMLGKMLGGYSHLGTWDGHVDLVVL